MFHCSFQTQRAALPSGIMRIVWRNAESLHPREMPVSYCPANQSVYCKIAHTPSQPRSAFSLSQDLQDRDGTNMVLHGLHWEPDIQVSIVAIRQSSSVLLQLCAHTHTFLWKFLHPTPNQAFNELPQLVTYQIYAEDRARKMLSSESKKINKHGYDIHTDWKIFFPQTSF